MGCVPPVDGYLSRLRALTQELGIVLIFDEVITGFRLSYGGAQEYFGVYPDLTCLGKVIGGGLPVGAYAGKRQIMEQVAPAGPMYQAGTLSGNPLAMTAGLVTLRALRSRYGEGSLFDHIVASTARLVAGIEAAAAAHGLPIQVGHVGTMFGFYFLNESGAVITDYASARAHADTARYGRFFHAMLARGVYFAPSQFEAAFVSSAHGEAEIAATLEAVHEVFGQLA